MSSRFVDAAVAVVAVAERPRLLCSLNWVSIVRCGGAAESEAERSGWSGAGGADAKSWTFVSWGEAAIASEIRNCGAMGGLIIQVNESEE